MSAWGWVVMVSVSIVAGGCTATQLTGESNAYPVVDQLSASAGANATEFSGSLASDVLTYVKKSINNQQVCVPTIFEDQGRASFHLQLKDPGSAGVPILPSPANTITFTRYHVKYIRTDGRSDQGIDVPYEFDGGMTMSVAGSASSTGRLVLVRAQAKNEAPLKALTGGGGRVWIATMAEVTFHGIDQAGRTVSVTGHLDVTFADWADPDC